MLNENGGSNEGAFESSDQYEVGYKKPPLNSQFKPGQSGNPAGRPAKTSNLRKSRTK